MGSQHPSIFPTSSATNLDTQQCAAPRSKSTGKEIYETNAPPRSSPAPIDDFDIYGLSDSSDEECEARRKQNMYDASGRRRCPGMGCTHTIPLTLMSRISPALANYDAFRENPALKLRARRLRQEICIMVRREEKKTDAIATALRRNWPVGTIKFQLIPSRVIAMAQEVELLVYDRQFREDSFIWGAFDGDLEVDRMSLDQFSCRSAGKMNGDSACVLNARAGYYGPKGLMIIMQTLLGLHPPNKTPTESFKPLTHLQLLTYILAPHVASKLIAADLGMSLPNGYQIKCVSSDVGELVNADEDDDDELDGIVRNVGNYFKGKHVMPEGLEAEVGKQVNAATALVQLTQMGQADQPQPQPRPRPRLVYRAKGPDATEASTSSKVQPVLKIATPVEQASANGTTHEMTLGDSGLGRTQDPAPPQKGKSTRGRGRNNGDAKAVRSSTRLTKAKGSSNN